MSNISHVPSGHLEGSTINNEKRNVPSERLLQAMNTNNEHHVFLRNAANGTFFSTHQASRRDAPRDNGSLMETVKLNFFQLEKIFWSYSSFRVLKIAAFIYRIMFKEKNVISFDCFSQKTSFFV